MHGWHISDKNFNAIRGPNGAPVVHPIGMVEGDFVFVCYKCAPALRHNKVPSCSIFNKLNFGVIPPQLKDLERVEQLMIAQIVPLVRLIFLRHGAIGHQGNVIALHRDVNEVAKLLPRRADNLGMIFVKSRDVDGITHTFKARPAKIQQALEWLKLNNPEYKDITIDYQYLKELEENPVVSPNATNSIDLGDDNFFQDHTDEDVDIESKLMQCGSNY